MTDTITPLQELSERLGCEATEDSVGQALADVIILRDSFDELSQELGCETKASSILEAVKALIRLREMLEEEAEELGLSILPLEKGVFTEILAQADETRRMAALGAAAQEAFDIDDLTVRFVFESADPAGLLMRGRTARVVYTQKNELLTKIVGKLAAHDAEASRFASKGEGDVAE